jgi:Peptidase MA superfamily
MIRLPLTLLALLLPALVLFAAQSSPARADATVQTATVENGYPKQLLFKLTATAPVEIKDVTLSYVVSGTGIRSAGKPDSFTPGTSITTEVKVDTNPNTNWVPIGNEITWHWELALADGTTTVTQAQSFVYLPLRDWKSLANENFVIYYTGNRENLAKSFADAMAATLIEHGQTLLKTAIPKKPVKLLLMGTNDELQEASPSKGTTLDNSRSVVTCGFRPGNADDLIFAAISCGGGDNVDTVRHEFGHILNAAAGESTLVKLPTWLDEGLAVYAQEKESEYTSAFNAANRGNRLIPFRQMANPTADESQIILQYGQSYMMVKYLIDTFGAAKLNELLALTKANTRFDEALKKTYSLDMDTFERDFKASLGGGAAPTRAPTTRPQQQPQATAVPTAAAQPRPVTQADEAGDDGISTPVIVIIGASVICVLLAVLAFLVMMFLQNQRRGVR